MTAPKPKYSEDPKNHPLRYYSLLQEVEERIRGYSLDELAGAARIMKVLSDFMWSVHFNQQLEFNQKSLVKTVDELSDILTERLHNGLIEVQQNLASSSKATDNERIKTVSDGSSPR